jgi:hypothetical protein
MPEIRQYQLQSNPSGPVNSPQANPQELGAGVGEATQQLGQRIEQAGQVVGDIVKQRDISQMNANLAKSKDRLGLLYQDQLQKGTLDHDSFMHSVNTELDGIQSQIGTPYGNQRFDQLKAATQLEFSQQAQMGQAHLVGELAVDDYKQFIDKNSSYLHNSPGGFDNALTQLNTYVDDLVAHHGLPAEKAPQLKTAGATELATNALRGIGSINPTEMKLQLAQGKWDPYMKGDTKYRMEQEADTYERAKDIEDARREKVAQKAADARQEAAKEGMLQKLYGDGLSTDEVLKNPDLDEAAKEHMLALMKTRNEDKITTDNSTTRQLFNQIHLPDGDPHKYIHSQDDLNKYVVQGKINFQALALLRGEFVGKGTIEGDANSKMSKAFENMAYQAIAKPDPTTHLPDPQGAQNYQTWLTDYMAKKQAALANGKKMSDLTNPKSPDYLGANFSQYQRTPDQIIKDMGEKFDQKPVPQGTPAPGASPTPPPEMVTVKDSSGKLFKIPKANLEKAKARGYKVQ